MSFSRCPTLAWNHLKRESSLSFADVVPDERCSGIPLHMI
jgi:hypothetical protein